MAGKVAGQASGKANAAWDKLEQVFEDRVARALGSLGVPTKADLDDLAKRAPKWRTDLSGALDAAWKGAHGSGARRPDAPND